MKKKYIHYGCGLTAPKEWENYDISPTLRIQKVPIIGKLFKNQLNTQFPRNVKFGNIIKGLPVAPNSCDGVYCSHVLEHLAIEDFNIALRNTYKILKPNGVFRCVVPDLEWSARKYVKALDNKDLNANMEFFNHTLLGSRNRARGLKGLLVLFLGNARHLWMWDIYSLMDALKKVGFREIRECEFNDSSDKMFRLVEEEGRFINAVSIECKK